MTGNTAFFIRGMPFEAAQTNDDVEYNGTVSINNVDTVANTVSIASRMIGSNMTIFQMFDASNRLNLTVDSIGTPGHIRLTLTYFSAT